MSNVPEAPHLDAGQGWYYTVSTLKHHERRGRYGEAPDQTRQ